MGFREAETAYGTVREKVYTGCGIEKVKTEYEHAAALARAADVPLEKVRTYKSED